MATALGLPLSSDLLYGFLMKQLNVIVTSHIQQICSYYITSYSEPKRSISPTEQDDEHELELLQIDRLLKWMELVFDDTFTPHSDSKQVDHIDTHRMYKQELFNIYRTLCSDYKQYHNWKKYNQSIWLFTSYRKRDTKYLAHKIVSDVRLFKEGLQLFFMMGRNIPKDTNMNET